MAKMKKDLFVNRAIQRVTMSAANTLTFQQVNFAVGAFQGVALLVHRLIYHVGYTAIDEILGADDLFMVAMTTSAQIADIRLTHIEVVDQWEMFAYISGTPANEIPTFNRIESDFTSLPGGGLILPANPIYIAMSSSGLVVAGTCDVEIMFTFRELSDADYIELIQSRVQANI